MSWKSVLKNVATAMITVIAVDAVVDFVRDHFMTVREDACDNCDGCCCCCCCCADFGGEDDDPEDDTYGEEESGEAGEETDAGCASECGGQCSGRCNRSGSED